MEKDKMNIGDIDAWRKPHLAIAEWFDAWRIIPRAVIAGYTFLMWYVIQWYMKLTPYILENCDPEILGKACLIMAPSTQHAALVSTVVGIAAAVFGLYASSGKKWNGFTEWKKKPNGEEPTPKRRADD